MKARFVAVILGLIAGIAAFLACSTSWTQILTAIGVRQAVAAMTAAAPTLAWATTAGVAGFAGTVLVVMLAGGLAETSATRRAINALRYDSGLAGKWTLADWLAAFASSAVADRADAMVTMIGPPGRTRRIAVDTGLLMSLTEIWLDRLTMTRIIAPLALLLLAADATIALIAAATGSDSASLTAGEAAFAAATAGWLAIRLALYLVRLALTPAVASAVAAATAAILPLTSLPLAGKETAESPDPTPLASSPPALDSAALADALADALATPLSQLAEATEALAAAVEPAARNQTIDATLADIRAGIERLLKADGGR